MLSKPCKLRIRTGASKNLGISRGGNAAAFALQRTCDDGRTATAVA